MKRVSGPIESVGYYYADSEEDAYSRLVPSSILLGDSPESADDDGYPWRKLYRIRFIVEPVED